VSRILIVAEPAPARDELAQVLAAAPHTVKTVAPGELVMTDTRDWAPDVILMHIGTDGPALNLRIGLLRDPDLAEVPFVAMGDSEDEARALGAHAFVRPPVAAADLLSLVARFAAARMPLFS